MSTPYIEEVHRAHAELSDLAYILEETPHGTLLNVYPPKTTCCAGHCCFEGKKICAKTVAPHRFGVAILTDDWRLNNLLYLPGFEPIRTARTVEGSPFDGYSIGGIGISPSISVRWKNPQFIEHPRGLMIISEEDQLDRHFIALDILVLTA